MLSIQRVIALKGRLSPMRTMSLVALTVCVGCSGDVLIQIDAGAEPMGCEINGSECGASTTVCYMGRCHNGSCVYERAPTGTECEHGFCDGAEACLSVTEWTFNGDSCSVIECTDSMHHPAVGCVYKAQPNGWSCDYPQQGACLDGVCIPGE